MAVVTLVEEAALTASSVLWSQFWSEGSPGACTDAFPAAAQSRIATRWRTLFAEQTGASVLDVACGRGAVMAHAMAAQRAPVTGVDFAAPETLIRKDFDIRGGVDAAALPFPDRSHDTVSSQFGIEYAGLLPAVAQAARVARANVLLLLHAAEGEVVRQAQEQVEQCEWVASDLGAFGVLRAHVMSRAPASAAVMRDLGHAIRHRANASENYSLLGGFAELVDMLADDPTIADIATLETGWSAHAARMKELLRVAPDRAQADQASCVLSDAGFTVTQHDERSGDDLIGRWITAIRNEGVSK